MIRCSQRRNVCACTESIVSQSNLRRFLVGVTRVTIGFIVGLGRRHCLYPWWGTHSYAVRSLSKIDPQMSELPLAIARNQLAHSQHRKKIPPFSGACRLSVHSLTSIWRSRAFALFSSGFYSCFAVVFE